jgi:hypothetical protein
MAPESIYEPVGIPVPQEPSSTPIDTNNENDPQTGNEEKEVSVGEILYGVELFHAIVQTGTWSYRVKDVPAGRRDNRLE